MSRSVSVLPWSVERSGRPRKGNRRGNNSIGEANRCRSLSGEKCGADKGAPLEACEQCHAAVATETDRLHAFALSKYCMSQLNLRDILQDWTYGTNVATRYRLPPLPRRKRAVTAELGRSRSCTRSTAGTRHGRNSPVAVVPKLRADAPAATELERNPFAVLGESLRDNRAKLMELAGNGALTGIEDEVVAARPRSPTEGDRLSAEIGWLPGTSPAKVAALIDGLRKNPGLVLWAAKAGLDPLTVANLTAAAMELIDPAMPATEWAGLVSGFGTAEDEIDADDVLRDINEDRAVAGLPGFSRPRSRGRPRLSERRRRYKDVTFGRTRASASNVLVEALTAAVEEATSGGDLHAPLLSRRLHGVRASRGTAIEKGATGVVNSWSKPCEEVPRPAKRP